MEDFLPKPSGRLIAKLKEATCAILNCQDDFQQMKGSVEEMYKIFSHISGLEFLHNTHIVISGIMQLSLKSASQVAIMQHLMLPLSNESVFIPQVISMDACIIHPKISDCATTTLTVGKIKRSNSHAQKLVIAQGGSLSYNNQILTKCTNSVFKNDRIPIYVYN